MAPHRVPGAGRPKGSKSACTLKMITDSCKTLSAEQRKRVVEYAGSLIHQESEVAQGIEDDVQNVSETSETPETSESSGDDLRKSSNVHVKFSDWEGNEGIEDDSDSDKTEENVPLPKPKQPKRKVVAEDFAEISEDDFAKYAIMKGFAKNTITEAELLELEDLAVIMTTTCEKLNHTVNALKSCFRQ